MRNKNEAIREIFFKRYPTEEVDSERLIKTFIIKEHDYILQRNFIKAQ